MSTSSLDGLRREAEALSESVARALWMAHAGHAPTAALAALYARHAATHDEDALDVARERAAAAPGDALAEWIAETAVARRLAPLDEREIAWERDATVRLADGRVLEYGAVPIALANARDRAERAMLDAARTDLVARELAPLRRDRLAREHDATAALAIADGYVATFARLTGIDVAALAGECDRLLADTQAMWDDVLPAFARRRLGVPVRELTRADVPALFRAPEFDVGFAPGGMVATIRTQVGAMGLEATAGGRIRYDVGERPGKRARAFCAPVRVPDEVHLVLRPSGGAQDWRTLLHEVGHALHFAHMRADLPFEARWAGDHSVTEGFAMLLDHLLGDRGWLRRYAELDAVRLPEFLRASAFQELYMVRRYAAKLRYELALHAGELPLAAIPDLYVETMTAATGVQHHAADAFVDVDARLYVVRYLRAWQLQAVLAGALRERWNEDWWRNPGAGPWLAEVAMAPGQARSADALATTLGGALSFAPVVRAIEGQLA